MPADKLCLTCGRRITWRKKWADHWDEVTRCSKACRSRRPGGLDRELEHALVTLAEQRGPTKTLCPSEAARRVRPDDWRPLMERTRSAARRLVAAGRMDVLQGGAVVDASTARGAIRLRRAERPPAPGWEAYRDRMGTPE